jgi:hypothetical protein
MLAALLVGATAGVAAADHYPNVPRAVERKDKNVLESLRRLTYAESWHVDLAAGGCDCLEPTCEGDGQFMVSCGGELDPPLGFLSAVRRTSRETCLVCGCAVDAAVLRATPVCLGF